jgi:hypothetical protein
MLTNSHTGTRIDEVAEGIYRINTPLMIDAIPGGFNLSQYLVLDEEPLNPWCFTLAGGAGSRSFPRPFRK